MVGDSFQFNGKNSLLDFNIRMVSYDYLMPNKRKNRIKIPNRHGTYDLESKYYDEKEIRVWCNWVKPVGVEVPREQLRDIASWLSEKGNLTFYNEPNKYYVAEIFKTSELEQLMQENITNFELTFTCFPFAMGRTLQVPLQTGITKINYEGTAETPTIIQITNTGTTDLRSVAIRGIRRV